LDGPQGVHGGSSGLSQGGTGCDSVVSAPSWIVQVPTVNVVEEICPQVNLARRAVFASVAAARVGDRASVTRREGDRASAGGRDRGDGCGPGDEMRTTTHDVTSATAS
jgi:hypothetical protein